ncbi:MAG: ATP-binding cassette domain-containing protein [Acidobacteriaceae bacterium]
MASKDIAANAPAGQGTALAEQPGVEFQHVSIGFDGHSVLTNVSFTARSGEMVIILGPAGGGKSILLKLANGLLRPDSGRIWIFGEEISSMPERELFAFRRNIGMVFQESALFDSLSVRDNVAYRLEEQHDDEADIDRRVHEVLRFVELEDAIDKFPDELSGGMRRRVAIARAIITEPKLLLYDSPTGGLDPITSTTIIQLVMKQRDVYDNTALLVTHRLQDAFTLATHQFNLKTNQMERIPGDGTDPNTNIMVLKEGQIAFAGSLLDLLRSKDPYIQEFLA